MGANYNDNSREAHKATKKKTGREKVLHAIRNGAKTQEDISMFTGMPRATVSGRCNDLLRDNEIYVEFKARNRKGLPIDSYEISWEGSPEYKPKPTYKEFVDFVINMCQADDDKLIRINEFLNK